MKRKLFFIFFVLTFSFSPGLKAQTVFSKSISDQKFELAVKHSTQPQSWVMESKLITYALNGDRTGEDVFRLFLKCNPSKKENVNRDEYICTKFTVQFGNAPEVEIPSLKNWSYLFNTAPTETEDGGEVLGINHAKFENLTDANGKALPPDKTYHVYNAFIDFHAICNVFSEKTSGGNGIQDLHTVGQKIVHVASYSQPPVDLGSSIKKGSYFKNGKITLELKGFTIANGKQCALLDYDSGESSFKMLMTPMPGMDITTVGSSHYKGDIYKDLTSGWIQKASLFELVVSETILPMPPNKVNSVIEREISINNKSEQ